MESEIARIYGNRVRVRVCGLCWHDQNLLMINHRSVTSGDFWSPPGGGVEFGQSLEENLIREFKEETGLDIKPGRFLFGCEFIQPPLHAIELFFEAPWVSGTLQTGHDPELQIIHQVEFLSPEQIMEKTATARHGIFRLVKDVHDLRKLSGFYRI